MTGAGGNLPASVAQRLLNKARETGDDYQILLTSYCFERFLYRLGVSAVCDRFVLKGAMLLRLWSDQPYRATRDLDLLRRGDASHDAILADFRAICATDVAPDGVDFDADGIRIEAVRVEDEYAGIRVTLPARMGTARLALQIDLGVGDAVWPAPLTCTYPVLLAFPAPIMLAYPREAVIAEKLEALVVLGDRNSRIKDFFDLYHLASGFTFDRATLVEAVGRTFARRQTPIPTVAPIGLTAGYWDNPSRPAQVRAFARRVRLPVAADAGIEMVGLLSRFLLPVLDDQRVEERSDGTWLPGGPWTLR